MFKGRRYLYAVFMAHLSVEKTLKAVYHNNLGTAPPKTHSLVYLLGQINAKPDDKLGEFIVKLSQASIVTRYPETLKVIQKQYSAVVVKKIVSQTEQAIKWLKSLIK